MKFEINENKLEMVIFKYLDRKDFTIEETDDNYYFLEDKGDVISKIRVKKDNMYCLVHYKLSKELKTFFSLNDDYLIKVLTNYVNKTLDIKLSKIEIKNVIGLFVVNYWSE